MVLMTSLSVLTTEGWMMVAPQGTPTTGGQKKGFMSESAQIMTMFMYFCFGVLN